MTSFLRLLLVWVLVAIGSQVQAVTLGKLTLISSEGDPFVATIALEMTDAELKVLDKFHVVEADASTYEKLGLQAPSFSNPFELSIVSKPGKERASVIKITSKEPLNASLGLFKDILVELSWSSGLIRRVYTIMSDREKGIKIADGENLSLIAARIQPDMLGATFDQTLIALYRANPQAFFSGNIHRLKSGEVLKIPSPDMAKSIPKGEAFSVTAKASKAYLESLDGVNKKSEEDKVNIEQDRLKVGSSEADDDLKKERTKHIEELVAQEKILADTKLRIAELEKNIADLKKVISKDSFQQKKNSLELLQEYALYVLFFLVTVLLVVLLIRANRLNRSQNPSQFGDLQTTQLLRSSQLIQTSDKKESDLSVQALEEKSVPSTDMPLSAKQLFEGIDLDLTPVKKVQQLPFKLVSYAEQKVKLNLAKSYLKIDDQMTAKLVLEEIINLGSHASPDILQEARHLRTLILV